MQGSHLQWGVHPKNRCILAREAAVMGDDKSCRLEMVMKVERPVTIPALVTWVASGLLFIHQISSTTSIDPIAVLLPRVAANPSLGHMPQRSTAPRPGLESTHSASVRCHNCGLARG